MSFFRKHFKKIIYIIAAVIFIGGMILASLRDLAISAKITHLAEDPMSIKVPVIGLIAELLGEWPASILGAFCAAIIMRSLLAVKKAVGYIFGALCALAVPALMFRGVTESYETAKFIINGQRASLSASDYIVAVPLVILLSLAIIAISLLIKPRTAKKLLVPAIVCGVMLAALSLGLVVVKTVWGRVRLRDMVLAGDLSRFTPWYVPNFFSGNTSMPSGHTANTVILALIPLFFSKKTNKRLPYLKPAFCSFIGISSVFMAYTRIAVGAHFLSDVLVGGMLGFVCTALGYCFMEKIEKA